MTVCAAARLVGPLTVGVLAFGLGAPASASMEQPGIASAVPSASTPHAVDDAVVHNANVHTFTQVGSTMYAGGEFHTVASPGLDSTYVRDNLFSFDVNTGEPTGWQPKVNGMVYTTLYLAPYLYVGGSFTSADGVSGRLVRYQLGTYGDPAIDTRWSVRSINGPVSHLGYANGQLIVAGSFSKRLVALSQTSGKDTGYFSLNIDGKVAAGARTEVSRFAVSPDGTRLLAIGNFATVNGETRRRAFMVDLHATSATLDRWYYRPLMKRCTSHIRPYLRDVDFSPDGTYFVLVSTGFVPRTVDGVGTDLCDSAARFETGNKSPGKPTWINYTGGDTLHSVAVVGSAVYVGGHERWLNNPQGRNSPGPGAVSRRGVGALDPTTGQALDWNPTKTRGVGTKVIYPTSTGVWFGSDGRYFAKQVHDSIAFTPLPLP